MRDLEAGTFEGTGVRSVLIFLRKPKEEPIVEKPEEPEAAGWKQATLF